MKLASPVYADRIAASTQEKFGGLRHVLQATDGEIFDMRNLSCEAYPLLQTRAKRWSRDLVYQANEEVRGFAVFDGEMVWSVGEHTMYGVEHGDSTSIGTNNDVKRYARLNNAMVIWPDKVYLTHGPSGNHKSAGKMEATITIPPREEGKDNGCNFESGTLYGVQAEANSIVIRSLWTEYDVYGAFTKGDVVTISGCERVKENNITAIIREIEKGKSSLTLRFDENVFTLAGEGGHAETATVTITRSVPDMDGIFEHDNRLWGWKGSTIYASKLGDLFNWNVYDGTADDAWSIDLVSEGDITGGCSYGGYPTFFKENCILKVYGSIPSEFRVSEVAAHGVKAGCDLTLAEAEGVLFYLSPTGVCAYTGGMPSVVSREAFDDGWLVNGTAGSDGQCYHISAETCDGERVMLVYDVDRRVWHREDDAHAVGWGYADETLYFMDPDGVVWGTRKFDDNATEENALPWMAELGDFTAGTTRKKAVSKIEIRAAVSGTMRVYISYDGDEWKECYDTNAMNKKTVMVPIRPRRSDHFRLKIEGEGECTVYSIATYKYVGSSK